MRGVVVRVHAMALELRAGVLVVATVMVVHMVLRHELVGLVVAVGRSAPPDVGSEGVGDEAPGGGRVPDAERQAQGAERPGRRR